MSMLEKIADAIGEADVCGDLHEAGYINLARAALTAMMEPTAVVLDAGEGFGESGNFDEPEAARDSMLGGWQAMIQAILNEGAEK